MMFVGLSVLVSHLFLRRVLAQQILFLLIILSGRPAELSIFSASSRNPSKQNLTPRDQISVFVSTTIETLASPAVNSNAFAKNPRQK